MLQIIGILSVAINCTTKINKKKKTKEKTEGDTDALQKTSPKIPSITSDLSLSQTSKFHLAQNQSTKFKETNFSSLKTNLVTEANVSGVFLNFCCLNVRPVNNQTLAISDFILFKNIDICTITERWLSDHTSSAMLNELTSKGYKVFH